VDTAIAIRPLKTKYKHLELKNLILVIGDCDFVDMVKLMKETYGLKVWIFAWSASIDYQIQRKDRGADEIIYFDELFKKISVPKAGANLTNADRLRKVQEIENL
jgi:hypothetical protein